MRGRRPLVVSSGFFVVLALLTLSGHPSLLALIGSFLSEEVSHLACYLVGIDAKPFALICGRATNQRPSSVLRHIDTAAKAAREL